MIYDYTRNVPILDLTNLERPTYISGMEEYSGRRIKSLQAMSCHSITVKNVITPIDSSIIVCTTDVSADCLATVTVNPNGTIAYTCPTTVLPDQYYNMLATFSVAANQAAPVVITFKYVVNGVPETIDVTLSSVTAGILVVSAFGAVAAPVTARVASDPAIVSTLVNQALLEDEALTLYGADVTSE